MRRPTGRCRPRAVPRAPSSRSRPRGCGGPALPSRAARRPSAGGDTPSARRTRTAGCLPLPTAPRAPAGKRAALRLLPAASQVRLRPLQALERVTRGIVFATDPAGVPDAVDVAQHEVEVDLAGARLVPVGR